MELLPQLRRRARLLRFHPAQPRDHRSARHAEPLVPRLLGLPVSLYLQAHPSRPAALGSDRVGSMALGRDMLQVGCAHGPGGASDPGLTLPETRTHFYAWVIVSSPLTLSHNVNDPVISERVWPIIANTEALAVSEAYFGHSGTMYKGSEEKVVLTDAAIDADPADDLVPVSVSAGQYFYKQMSHDGSITAVLAMNANTATTSMTVDFTEIPGVKGTKFTVRDINAHKDLGSFTGKWTGDVEGHDVAFLLLTAA